MPRRLAACACGARKSRHNAESGSAPRCTGWPRTPAAGSGGGIRERRVSPHHPLERGHEMTEQAGTTLELVHTMMDEAEALRFLEGQRISLGSRTMDPKAQIVGEFVKSIRVPGYFPPLAELRQQLRTMVTLMDEPAPPLSRIEDIAIPGPSAAIPSRVYDPAGTGKPPRPVVGYFHGGGWVQGDLETHHGLCARLAQRSGALVVAVDYRLAPEHKFPAAVE